MKKLLAVVLFCLPAFGQAAYSGPGLYSGPAGYVASSGGSCAAPNFCAYTGTDLIPWGTIPNFGGATNNNATAYDTSYLGHTNFDGSTFGNSALLSPVTRLTDSVSAYGKTNANFNAGMGGSGVFTLTNTNTSLVRVDASSMGLVCAFSTAGANQGHCGAPPSGWGGTPPSSGIFITTGQNTNGSCTSACPVNDFGSLSFSLTDPTVLYTFGNDSHDISTPTTVTPYTINPATGAYSVGSPPGSGNPIVDFQYGLPLGNNAPAWAPSTSYAYGAYVTHALNPPGGANPEYLAYNLNTPTSYNVGDIVVPGSGGGCMYRAITVTGQTSSTSPTFHTSTPCQNDSIADGGVKWRGTNSTAQFVYQNTGSAGTSASSAFQWIATPATLATNGAITSGSATLTSTSNPFTAQMMGQAVSVSGAGNSAGTAPLYTTILSYQNVGQVTLATTALHTVTTAATIALTGHPDIMSSTVADSGGIVWTNVGPSYVIANGNQLWHALGGISRDTAYGGYASKYGIAISTNSYGLAPTYSKYTADQGSGAWGIEYDAVTNVYHLLNTLTGIWTDWSCASGSGYSCPRTGTTVGTLSAFSNPFLTGQSCPFYIHNLKLSSNGSYAVIVSQADVYPACSSPSNFLVWQTTTSSFDATQSLQFTFRGMNHWAIGTNKMVAFTSSGWGYTAGVFLGVYNADNAQGNHGSGAGYAPPFSVYLNPLASQSTPQTTPPSCYVTASAIKNPDCNLSEILDSHLSWAGDPGTDTYPACGTSYNYATLGPAFNAWQNMETCYQTFPTYPTGYAPPAAYTLPSTSVGNVWQFTHTFATGTSVSFSTQFQISEYSQDANWLFWSSDWNCQNGSTTGSVPTVYTGSGTYYQMLAITPVPANPTSLCGLPWAGSTSYVAGNLINPIEGTGGGGQVDDVFQALTSGTTGSTQPGPALPNSYFSTSTPPSVAPASITAATESGTTVTVTSTLNPAVGVQVNISGVTPLGYNGTWFVTASTSSTFTYTNTASGLGDGTVFGAASSAGSTICDSASGAAMNPTLPYSTSCPTGTVWQDIGPQNQRGDVFAVNLGNQR
jgi:hypothetical protein